MGNNTKFNFEEVTISEVSIIIEELLPDLSLILKSISIGKSYNCYKARYKYGDTILSNGMLHFTSDDGHSIPVTSDLLPETVRNDLSYNILTEDPLAIFLNKTSEAYMVKDSNIINSVLLSKGSIIGIPRALNTSNNRSAISNYEINAGVRSLFMLTKISDRKIYNKIEKNYNINLQVPSSAEEHWQTFVQITRSLQNDWCCEVIFFSREFIKDLKKIEMAAVNVCLNNIHTSKYNMKHNNASIWNVLYFMGIENDNLLYKYNTNYINIIKHIFMVAANSDIGFIPATNDSMAPITLITKFFKDAYGVVNPVIMEPSTFDYTDTNQQPVYLSLNHQIVMTNALDKNKKKTNLSILEEIRYLLGVYCKNILEDFNLSDMILQDLLKHIEIIFFHTQAKNGHTLTPLEDIMRLDTRFNNNSSEMFEAIKGSPFFNGGICLKVIK